MRSRVWGAWAGRRPSRAHDQVEAQATPARPGRIGAAMARIGFPRNSQSLAMREQTIVYGVSDTALNRTKRPSFQTTTSCGSGELLVGTKCWTATSRRG